MLKPKKKMTRAEIKKDPLLETTYKAQAYLSDNKSLITKIGGAVLVVVAVAFFLVNNAQVKAHELQSALGKALVVYGENDLAGAELQFQLIQDMYSGSDESALAGYYLGKIAYDRAGLEEARGYLEGYLKNAQVDLLSTNACVMLADIYRQQGDMKSAISQLKSAVKFASAIGSGEEMQVALAGLYLENDQKDDGRKIIDKLLENESLPANLKRQAEELAGKFQVM